MNSEEIRFLDDARFYVHEKNLSVLPLDGKRPPRGFSWKHLTNRLPTDAELQQWARSYQNLGVICGRISRVLALDADNQDTAERLIDTLPPTDMITRTAKGVHLFFRIREGQEVTPRVRIGGMMLDVRGEISYVVAARSIHPETGQRYERVGSWNLEKVPYFDPAWIEREDDKRSITRKVVRSIDSYLAKVESIQGHHGSAGLVRACAICRDAGISEAEAMAKLVVWNQLPALVQPPWSLDELARAVTRTYARRKPA